VRAESGVDPLALRDARIRMALTQHELARLIDVAGGERISRWELGSSAPRPEMLRRLAQALNVDVLDLLDAGGPADLRRLRTSAGLSARTLAARAHLSAPTYIRWESVPPKAVGLIRGSDGVVGGRRPTDPRLAARPLGTTESSRFRCTSVSASTLLKLTA
jgi:transcriptional regulator with XRE-family HTH domain